MTTENADNGKTSQSFFKFPKFLLKEEYEHISFMAKGLYAILLDRRQLSIKNNWIDEHGVYIIIGRIEAGKTLGKNEKTARKFFKELVDNDFIFEKKQGFNKPNKIYFKETGKNYRLVPVIKPGSAESFLPPNKTEYNNTDLNKTEYLHNSSQNSDDDKKISIRETYNIDYHHNAYYQAYTDFFNEEPRRLNKEATEYIDHLHDYNESYEFFLKSFKGFDTLNGEPRDKCSINILDKTIIRNNFL